MHISYICSQGFTEYELSIFNFSTNTKIKIYFRQIYRQKINSVFQLLFSFYIRKAFNKIKNMKNSL